MNPAAVAAVLLGLGAAYLIKVFVIDKGTPAPVNALALAKQIQLSGSVVATSPNLLGPEQASYFQTEGGARFWKKENAAKLSAALAALDAHAHSSVADVWMLGGTGDKAMSKVTPAQLMTFADKSAAILPVLS